MFLKVFCLYGHTTVMLFIGVCFGIQLSHFDSYFKYNAYLTPIHKSLEARQSTQSFRLVLQFIFDIIFRSDFVEIVKKIKN